jgi:uncharacterized metal-binding protein YceD (DUF177 family)
MLLKLSDLKEKTSLKFVQDYQDQIANEVDILSIDPAHIQCEILSKTDELLITVHVDVQMELACSKTLKPVPYHMQFDADIVFGSSEDAEYPITDPIELSDIIFGYILSEKPYTIYHPDAEKTSFDKEKSPHPAFADLDKIVKK